MSMDHIDVESLPELKISAEAFDALTEITGEESPAISNGFTWKRRVYQPDHSHKMVICRYRTHSIGGPITLEMVRPVITGPVVNTHEAYKRKDR